MCLVLNEPGGAVIAFAVDFMIIIYIVDNRLAQKLIITLTLNGFH